MRVESIRHLSNHCTNLEVCVVQTYKLKMECFTSDGEVLCT